MSIKNIKVFFSTGDLLVQLPVNPQDIEITSSSDNSTSTIVKLGQINQLGLAKLRELTITSFLPSESVYFANTNGRFQPPEYYITFFQNIMKSRKPFRIIVTETEINMVVSIESFDIKRKHGTDDVDFVLGLKEYKEHGIKKLVKSSNGSLVGASGGSNTSRESDKAISNNYTVKTGDSLWLIACNVYGDGSRWVDIYNANKGLISNPSLIYAGWVLTIPRK